MAKDRTDHPLGDGQLIISPASYRITGPDAQTPGSLQVIQSNAHIVNNFVEGQRRAVSLSSNDVHRASYEGDDLDIHYRSEYGTERIDLVPYVRQPEPQPEPQFDYPVPETPVHPLPEIPEIEPGKFAMVVLYKRSKIAVFDMASINKKKMIPVDNRRDPESDFGDKQLRVMQMQFDKYSFALHMVDFANHTRASKLCLSSSLLVDTLVTETDSNVVPILNASQDTVYSVAGEYSYDRGDFSLVASLEPDLYPYAFSDSGTCYYYPYAGGALTFRLAHEFKTVTSKKVGDTGGDDADNPPITTHIGYYVSKVTDHNHEVTRYDTNGYYLDTSLFPPVPNYPSNHDGYTEETETFEVETTVLLVESPIKAYGKAIGGIGYTGTGYIGSDDIPGLVAKAYAPNVYYDFDLDANENKPKYSEGAGGSYGFTFQMPLSPPEKDVKGITFADAFVDAETSGTVTIGDKDPGPVNNDGNYDYALVGYGIHGQSVRRSDSGEGYRGPEAGGGGESIIDLYVYDVTADMVRGADVIPQPPVYQSGEGGADAYVSEIIAACKPVDQKVWTSDPFVITTTRSNSGSSTVQVTGGDAAKPVIGGLNAAAGDGEYTTDIHLPDHSYYKTDASTGAALTAFGQTLHVSGNTTAEIIYYPFPLARSSDKPFFIVDTDTKDTDSAKAIYLGDADMVEGKKMRSWLHLANPAHCIQGVIVDGRPKLFYNGDPFEEVLTDALKCDAIDIAAIYIDVPFSIALSIGKLNVDVSNYALDIPNPEEPGN